MLLSVLDEDRLPEVGERLLLVSRILLGPAPGGRDRQLTPPLTPRVESGFPFWARESAYTVNPGAPIYGRPEGLLFLGNQKHHNPGRKSL